MIWLINTKEQGINYGRQVILLVVDLLNSSTVRT